MVGMPSRRNRRTALARMTRSIILPIDDRLLGGQGLALLSPRTPRESAKLRPVCESDVSPEFLGKREKVIPPTGFPMKPCVEALPAGRDDHLERDDSFELFDQTELLLEGDRLVIDFMEKHVEVFGRRRAIVTRTLLQYGLGRMGAVLESFRGVEVGVFRDEAEARAWLLRAESAAAS